VLYRSGVLPFRRSAAQWGEIQNYHDMNLYRLAFLGINNLSFYRLTDCKYFQSDKIIGFRDMGKKYGKTIIQYTGCQLCTGTVGLPGKLASEKNS